VTAAASVTASSAAVSYRMGQQRRRDTAPEMELRRVLHSRGLRYRVNRPVPGLPRRTIDVAFTKSRVAVLVHGCFWHGCPEHGTQPRANSAWWAAKLRRNVERDEQTAAHLRSIGWRVVTVWEHESAQSAADRVGLVVKEQKAGAGGLPGTPPGGGGRVQLPGSPAKT
jgi:DNA mismatch endonuclease (patch repair protein)